MKLVSKRVEKCQKCSGIGFHPFCEDCGNTGKIQVEVYTAPYVPEVKQEVKPIAKLKIKIKNFRRKHKC